MNRLKHGLSSAGVALLAFAFRAPPAMAGGGEKPKPDLVVTKAGQNGQPYGFYGEHAIVGFSDTTKNRGSARARSSWTALAVSPHPELERPKIRVATRVVGKLGPKKSGSESEDSESGSEEEFYFDIALGAYYVFVCADALEEVKESNEKNNCKRVAANRSFFVTKRTWTGTMSGFVPFGSGGSGDSMERWTSPDAAFEFDQYLGGGLFTYLFRGTVTWTVSGTDGGGCTWSGSGTRTFSGAPGAPEAGGGLSLDYLGEQYTGGTSADDFSYDIHVQCGEDGANTPGPISPLFWSPNQGGQVNPLPFGTDALAGSSQGPSGVTWVWDLR